MEIEDIIFYENESEELFDYCQASCKDGSKYFMPREEQAVQNWLELGNKPKIIQRYYQ